MRFAPATMAASHSPPCKATTALCRQTMVDEQAVSSAKLVNVSTFGFTSMIEKQRLT